MDPCSLLDSPNYDVPDKNVPKEERRKWLMDLCVKYINKFLINFKVDPLMQQMQNIHEQTKNPKFVCRIEECSKTYVHHSTRVK